MCGISPVLPVMDIQRHLFLPWIVADIHHICLPGSYGMLLHHQGQVFVDGLVLLETSSGNQCFFPMIFGLSGFLGFCVNLSFNHFWKCSTVVALNSYQWNELPPITKVSLYIVISP